MPFIIFIKVLTLIKWWQPLLCQVLPKIKSLFQYFRTSGAIKTLTLRPNSRSAFLWSPRVYLSTITFHALPLSFSLVFLFTSHLSPNFLSSPIPLPVPFPNESFPVSLCLPRRSGHLGCFPIEHYVPAIYLSISLVNMSNSNINNTWAVINKFHKHPRRTSSLGLVLTDLMRDKEMMESNSGGLLNSQWIPDVAKERGGAGYEWVYRQTV